MKYKRYLFPVLMGSTMSIIMMLLNTGKVVFPGILVMMLFQSVVASLASLLFPAGMLGAMLTKKHFPKLPYIAFLLVSAILPAVYFTFIMTFSGLMFARGYCNGFWRIYLHSAPVNTVFGYFCIIFWNIILDRVIQ